jgi:receptor protein-tyrosine kinase
MAGYGSGQLNARAVLDVLRRRAGTILLFGALVPSAALGVSLLQDERYSATASLLFRDPALDQTLFGSTFFDAGGDPARTAATNSELVSLDVVADRTADALPAGELSAADIEERIDVEPDAAADIVEVVATDASARSAVQLANTFADEFVEFRREADRSKVRQAKRLLEREVESLEEAGGNESEREALEDNARRLDVLAALQTGNAELVQRADVPTSPSSPELVRNTALGLVLGIFLGLAFALLRERLDRRFRDSKEVEEAFGRPILGSIRRSRALAEQQAGGEPFPAEDADAFRVLAANLRYFNLDREVRSIVVTSAAPGEGKSTVAWNLAAVMASAGVRVIIVEGDLRHPTLAARVPGRPTKGLSHYLAGVASFDEVVRRVAVENRSNGQPGARQLDVIVAGRVPPNPAELIESSRMRGLIGTLEGRYDMVVIDTPPTAVVSDAIPLVKQAPGVIVVSRLGASRRDVTAVLRDQLENLGAPTLGIVINDVRVAGSYGYSYRYGSREERRRLFFKRPAGRPAPPRSPPPRARRSRLPSGGRQAPGETGSRSSSVPSRSNPTTPRNPPTERRPPPRGRSSAR